MADYLKRSLGGSLNKIATQRALDQIQITGKSLPAQVTKVISSGIVEVSFQVNSDPATLPNVIVPIEYPEYIRYPIKVGDKGMVISADVMIGNMTGLGSGVPNLNSTPGNLSALSFMFLGNTAWSPADDPQAVVIYGPNGVILRATEGVAVVDVQASGVLVQGSLSTTGNLSAGNGITCSFTTLTGQVVTVQNGIVTNIY